MRVSTARCLTCAVVAVAVALSLVACVGLIFVFYGERPRLELRSGKTNGGGAEVAATRRRRRRRPTSASMTRPTPHQQ